MTPDTSTSCVILKGAQVYPDQIWPGQITKALQGLIHATNLARQAGHDAIDPDERAGLLHSLRQGCWSACPRSPVAHKPLGL